MRNVARLLPIFLVFLASLSIHAQDAPDSVKSKFLKESAFHVKSDSESVSRAVERERKGFFKPYGKGFKTSMAVCVGGSMADIISTNGLQETNPLFRNEKGGLRRGLAISASLAVCGGTMLLEQKHPRLASVMRYVFGGVRFFFAVNNLRKNRL